MTSLSENTFNVTTSAGLRRSSSVPPMPSTVPRQTSSPLVSVLVATCGSETAIYSARTRSCQTSAPFRNALMVWTSPAILIRIWEPLLAKRSARKVRGVIFTLASRHKLPARGDDRSPARPLTCASDLSCCTHLEFQSSSAARHRLSHCLQSWILLSSPDTSQVQRSRGPGEKRCRCFLKCWYNGSDGSAADLRQNPKSFFIGSILLMAWAGLRFADAQRTSPSSLLPDRHVQRRECWRTKVSRSGQPFGALAFGFSGRPPSWGWGHVHFNALRGWLSTATTFLRRALQAPQMHNTPMTPEQARQYTLHSLKATMLSIAKQVDVPEHHRAEHGHHHQLAGRASIRPYSRHDVWRALACQKLVVQRVAEGFSPTHSTGAWEVDPLAVRSTAEAHAGNTKRAAFGIPSEIYRGFARLEQHSKPALLGTGLPLLETPNPSRVDALDPDHQREEARETFWKSKNDPVPAWNCSLKRAGKTSQRLTRPLCQRAPGVSTRSCRSAPTPSHFVEDAKSFDSRACYTQQYASGSGLRPPNLTELMSAGCQQGKWEPRRCSARI